MAQNFEKKTQEMNLSTKITKAFALLQFTAGALLFALAYVQCINIKAKEANEPRSHLKQRYNEIIAEHPDRTRLCYRYDALKALRIDPNEMYLYNDLNRLRK